MTDTAPTEAFHALARAFCVWCESDSLGPKPETQLAVWLSRLHAAALELPDADPDNEDGIPDLPATPLRRAERNFAALSGTYYRTVFDPDPRCSDDPVLGDIGDDLQDSYKDIKAGCLLYETGRVQEALWFWSYMHRLHWGKHAVCALAALHSLLQSDENAA